VLKLRRIELIGFKSFYDKGEILINESGVTAIVGPNGCGKSNVSDAIAWVLGEQSAKSLRGEKMEDVIFNGTRSRAPMGMAQVTITLTGFQTEHSNGSGNGNGNGHGNGNGDGPKSAGPRDIVVQRRLYRSGESIYLIDGRPCRLRDIHEIFLGTGLGPNSYAIIEQGRVGQLLTSKPSDRRTLIEEAAGITKFKAKRKLAESRLEAAKQNLSRVNDILAEVDRQRNSLKRQAAKARRFIEQRNRMREILSSVFSTRAEMLIGHQEGIEQAVASIGDEGRRLDLEIDRLGHLVRSHRSDLETEEHRLAEARARHSELELQHEKASQRIERFRDQIHSLEERKQALAEERRMALEDLAGQKEEHAVRNTQLAELEADRLAVEQALEQTNASLAAVGESRAEEERAMAALRDKQFEIVGLEARLRNEIASREEMVRRLAMQVERMEREEQEASTATRELEGQLHNAREDHSGQRAEFVQLKNDLETADEQFSRNKAAHAEAAQALADARAREESVRHRLQTIGELAVQRAYSTESVQQFFSHVRSLDWAPLGLLADFVEVESGYEALVEDYLRRELQYVVVRDRREAESALKVVKDVTKGRLECLIRSGGENTATAGSVPAGEPGIIPLASVLRLDERVRYFADHVRDAYIVDSVDRAWQLSEMYPESVFLAGTGEVIRGRVIGWGEHEAHGPLSLRKEIRELDTRMDTARRETTALEEHKTNLDDRMAESEKLKARLLLELQDAEKAIITSDHRIQALLSEVNRAQERWKLAASEIQRFQAERQDIEKSVADAVIELESTRTQKLAINEEIQARQRRSEDLRLQSDTFARNLAGHQSSMAVLQERRSTVLREINTLRQRQTDLEERIARADRQTTQAQEQQDQMRETIGGLEKMRIQLTAERDRLTETIAAAGLRLEELRRELHESETRWDETRGLLDAWKDRHNQLEIEKTQVDSDLKHLASSCFSELGETIESVCIRVFETLPDEELEIREQEYRELREKIESMGAVNMMAVEEYQEAEQRFEFLTAQRQDLLDSIRDTVQAIDEIDAVCRRQFREAFEAINAGFTQAFVSLFGGGHGELRLLEEAGELDAGVEIVAQPPGKKLQNVLLLSGGEKALTALALLIALFRYKPSPFCVLDEVDAPLDDANVDRFAQMVRDMSLSTQFIVITHSKRTMETASALYGVTMEEPGISKIVSVRLN
jgi:chromosome segregation protein